MRNRALIGAIACVLLVSGISLHALRADAKDAPGCEGLAAYRVATFKVGRDYIKAISDDGITLDRNPITYSSDDWTAFADDVLDFQRGLKSIDPPAWAESWHELEVQREGLVQQLGVTAATSGVLAAVAFGDEIEKMDATLDQTVAEIAKICGDFPAFVHDWQALDGDIDGTPVATPSD